MKKKTSFSSILINIIFYPFMAIVLACAIGWFGFGIRPYITMSGSMEPAIHTGSVCFIDTDYRYDDVVVGDVIAYQTANGDRVTHRVIEVTSDGFVTQGDANDVSDGISTIRENFCGKNLFSIPYVGYGVKSLQSPVVIAVLAVLIGGFVITCLIDVACGKKEKRKSLPVKKYSSGKQK